MPRRLVTSRPSADLAAAARRIAELEADPALVSRIHHYCDRWCDRCNARPRCLSYQLEQMRQAVQGWAQSDPVHQSSWEQLTRVISGKLQRQEDEVKLSHNDAARFVEERDTPWHISSEAVALLAGARQYRQQARELLLRLPTTLEVAWPAPPSLTHHAPWAEVRDALEVVDWFVFFIEAKLQRAATSRSEEIGQALTLQASDAAGSAKIALIAIDRSVAAWDTLRRNCACEADAILDLLAQLERLRAEVDRAFPHAQRFRRPGFDDAGFSRSEGEDPAEPPNCE